MTVIVADLIVEETVERLFAKELEIAADLGLSTSTWRKGDPTRTTLYTLATLFQLQESNVADFIRGGFLGLAEGDWVYVKAEQDYGVTPEGATYAECVGTLTNGGALTFDFDPGDVIVSVGVGGKTFRNTETLHLDPSATLTDVAVKADEIGSASTAAAGAIDTMVSSFASVTFVNTTAAVGTDLEDPDSVVERARLKPASLSPNGPAEAYEYVAKTAALTNGADVTKTRVVDGPGTVTLYLANASGPVDAGDVTKVADAIATWCVPLGITPSILNSTAQQIDIAYEVYLYDDANVDTATVEELVEAALEKLFLARPIGGDVIPPSAGKLFLSAIVSAIEDAHPSIFRAVVGDPTTDTAATTIGHVFTLGAITPVVVFVAAP